MSATPFGQAAPGFCQWWIEAGLRKGSWERLGGTAGRPGDEGLASLEATGRGTDVMDIESPSKASRRHRDRGTWSTNWARQVMAVVPAEASSMGSKLQLDIRGK